MEYRGKPIGTLCIYLFFFQHLHLFVFAITYVIVASSRLLLFASLQRILHPLNSWIETIHGFDIRKQNCGTEQRRISRNQRRTV